MYHLKFNEEGQAIFEFIEKPFDGVQVLVKNFKVDDKAEKVEVDFQPVTEDMEKQIEEKKEDFEKVMNECINDLVKKSLEKAEKDLKQNK